MRTTLDIDDEIIQKIMAMTGASSKKKSVEIALQEFLRAKRREELAKLIGNYDNFALTLSDLEKMRHES